MNLEKWYELKDKTAALTLRERVIFVAVGVIVVLFLWAQIFYLDFEKELKNTKQEITSLQLEEWEQADQLAGLTARLADDPNSALFEIELPEDYLNVSAVKLSDWTFPANYSTFSPLSSNITMTFKINNPYNPGEHELSDPLQNAIFSALYNYKESNYKIIIEEAPIVPLYYDQVVRLTNGNVKDLGINALNLLTLKKVCHKILKVHI